MELNNITAYTLPNGVLSISEPALPEPARAFHKMLTPRMQIKKFDARLTGQYASIVEGSSALDLTSMFGALFPNASDRVAFCLISILKEDLKEEFSKHFEEIEGHPLGPKHLRILESYVTILVRHRGRAPGFASGYSTMAKEVSLIGILVDPAIDSICPGYDRDRKTLTAVVDYQRALFKWEPREDFCVAYGKDTARYALLNGETDSTGESDLQAMHKMSVLSRYSHGIIQQVTGKEDTVILSVYVSEGTCTMYLFYKTQSPTKPFVMQQILRLHDIISHPTHAVGFLRILHNFAAFVQRLDDEDLPEAQYLKRKIMEDMGTGLPSVSGETRAKRRKAEDNNPGNEGGESLPFGAGSYLALKYTTISCDLDNHCIRRVQPISPMAEVDMETDLIAKWTADTTEVDLIESLQLAKQPQYRNGVIRVTDIMHYKTLGTWVVMPRYTPLHSLPQITPQEYYGLRLHVVEAMAFLHAEGVVHRDIKPSNIVVDLKQELSMAKVYTIDFGNARRCTPEYRCKGFQGTSGWTAPEVQDGVSWEPMSADIWAMAKTLLYLAERAGIPDLVISAVVACSEPSARPTAAALFDTLPLA
ncbi:Sperm motility kinase 2A [Tulasnella sp. JGI-2019a]|nr:Sperm motility kinase 2A [Tulasnella sp. JGI-2019a]